MMSGSNRTLPAPRYTIQRRRTPCCRRPVRIRNRLRPSVVGRGRGQRQGVRHADRLHRADRRSTGGRFSWSMSISFVPRVINDGSRAAFLAMRSLSTSHSGCSHPFAWLVFPYVVNVHTSRRSFGQSAGTIALEHPPFPRRIEVCRLAAVAADIEVVVRPDGNVELLLGVPVEVAEIAACSCRRDSVPTRRMSG